jgi:hypothetical protein
MIKKKKGGLFGNASDNGLVKISATMYSAIFSLALQQISVQYPKEAISASSLIHLESPNTTNFLQMKGHHKITNHRNKEISYVGNLGCQCNTDLKAGSTNSAVWWKTRKLLFQQPVTDCCFNFKHSTVYRPGCHVSRFRGNL